MRRFTAQLAFVFTSLWIYVLFAPMMHRIEGQLLPVATLQKVSAYRDADNSLILTGYVRKERMCTWLGMVATVDDEATGETYRFPIAYYDRVDDGKVESRPVGSTAFGPWIIELPNAVSGTLKLYAHHSCHGMWDTETLVYKLNIEPVGDP